MGCTVDPYKDRGYHAYAEVGIPPTGAHLGWASSGTETGDEVSWSHLTYFKLPSPAGFRVAMSSTKAVGRFMSNV